MLMLMLMLDIGRHVGKLADNDAYEQGLAPAIAGANNTDWNMNEEQENDFDFVDNFGGRNDTYDFNHDVEFNDDDPNSYN